MPLCDLEGNPIPDDRCPVHPRTVDTDGCTECTRMLDARNATAVAPATLI